MGRTMAVTAAAVVCGGLVGFAATSYATSTGTPDAGGAYAAESASDDEGSPREEEHGLRLGLGWGDLLHGETVVEDPESGELVTYVQQRGEVVERADGAVTVESSDGTRWEWTLTDDTGVHLDGDWDAEVSGIEVGDAVMADGVREGDVRTAGHIGDPAPTSEEIRGEIREGLEELPGDLELPDPEDRPGAPPRFFEEHGGDGGEDSGEDSAA